MLSKVIGGASLIVTLLTGGATFFETLAPKYAVWAVVASATISAFTKAVTENVKADETTGE
jgi:hypothetical protein